MVLYSRSMSGVNAVNARAKDYVLVVILSLLLLLYHSQNSVQWNWLLVCLLRYLQVEEIQECPHAKHA